MSIAISFLGAAGTITGSRHLVFRKDALAAEPTHELVDVFARDAEVLARRAPDPLALLGGEVVVGVRDLEEKGACRDRDRIGTLWLLLARHVRMEELA